MNTALIASLSVLPEQLRKTLTWDRGTDLSRWSAEERTAVAYTIIDRPGKVLRWRTPAEMLADELRAVQDDGVATTG